METGKCRAFIFDMDGTLLDNTTFHTQSWLEVLLRLGVPATWEELHRRAAGKTAKEVLREFLGEELTTEQIREYSEQKERLFRELCQPHLKPLAGLTAFLTRSREMGIPMAVATAARERNIEFVLEGLKVKPFFSAVVGASDVRHGKPDPEMFLTAAQRLGATPGSCIVFEDSSAGIEAALRAGMRTVVVTTTLEPKEVQGLASVILTIDDFRKVKPEDLIEMPTQPNGS